MVLPLPLITPQGSNFLKDFPEQNAVNCDLIDNYAGPCLLTHPLRPFTPGLISSTGSANDPVLGVGGVNRGNYYQIFDQMHVWGEFRFGTSGFSVGSDIYIVTLPFIVDSIIGPSTIIGGAPIVGVGTVHDASSNAGKMPLTVHLRTSSQLMFGVRMNSGLSNRELRSAGYVSWGANYGVCWYARFRQAS